MKKNLFRIITVFLFLYGMSFAKVLPKGTKIYEKPSFKSKVVMVLDSDKNLKTYRTKIRAWYVVIIDGKRGYINVSSQGSPGGASAGSKKSPGRASGQRDDSLRKSRGKGPGSPEAGPSGGSLGKGGSGGAARSGSRGAAQGAPGSEGTKSAPRKLTEKEQLDAAHEEARMQAAANQEDFCSPCWYAQNGVDVERYEDTNPKFDKDGELIGGKSLETQGGDVYR